MQTSALPQTPAVPQPPATATTSAPLWSVPRNAAEVRVLRAQRTELSNQLVSVQGRRDDLSEELKGVSNAADRAGIESRLAQLDARILQIETDIASTGRLLAAAPLTGRVGVPIVDAGARMGASTPDGPRAFSVFVLVPLAIWGVYSLVRRRTRRPASAPRVDDGRLARLEQAVDAIAIEVERVSEGQRFVTKLMAEKQLPPGEGAMQRVPVAGAREEAVLERHG